MRGVEILTETILASINGVSRELAIACERGERDGTRMCLDRCRALFPELGIEMEDRAGALFAFAGAESPLSEACGVGLERPFSAGDVEAMTEFYRARGAVPRVSLGAVQDRALGALLARAGYVPVDQRNLLVVQLASLEAWRDDRITVATDPREWGNASALGFTDDERSLDAVRTTGTMIAAGGATALEARKDGEIVATAAYSLEPSGVLGLFAASTLAAHRRRGWQRAMIRDRIARGREAGMHFARVEATPFSDSERNFRALGFVPLYTRVLWELRAS